MTFSRTIPVPTRLFLIIIAMNTLPRAIYREAGLNRLRQHVTEYPAGGSLVAGGCLDAGWQDAHLK